MQHASSSNPIQSDDAFLLKNKHTPPTNPNPNPNPP